MLRTKTRETRPPVTDKASNTPDHVSIKPQRMGFEFDGRVPRYWLDNNYLLSHTMNALSVLFPEGEQFFVDAVRAFRGQIQDPKLKEEVRGFIGQEAMHSLEHIAMNQHVRDQGMPVEAMERDLKVLLDAVRLLPKRHQLAVTCALEHITAMMADLLLERNDIRDDMDESMQPLWVWHAIEETEHKAVAYDVFEQVGGTYVERTAYLVVSTAMLGVMTTWFTGRMMLNDRSNFSLTGAAKGLWRMWGVNGAFSSLIPSWLEYFKPGFHPWDKDNSELIANFKAKIEQHIAPQYQNGNRRTLQ
ncbi:metal-dependent hydrolase [Marinobacter qingdaonensis]|uniref:Metal-dependent hydrolase n=1 Tax=Marinobacter qingdaonensis TaxID=3108486 RepID=A0ABU5NWA5_9GAMM|nr:metal-dependent hydrolase [Marinobacter sp. ASW11-75]MEA1080054.1 metal-dependent hydrolase [Marinobacter sp. ASW11-75]MEE2762891.1 metal-dependent hydrolase [Pseudomonadota bacterium]MEE3118224.1 metal-dependent hydrolase [Pseudomonadota bacterium]